MIRLTSRNVVGLVGSAVLTFGLFGALHLCLSSNDAHRSLAHVTPTLLHSATIGEWQLAEENLVEVRAPRA